MNNITQEQALEIAKQRGLVPSDYQLPKKELSKTEAMQLAIERGLIKPREDGAGFLTRTKFSFADTDAERKQVLDDEYGKGNSYKVGNRWLVKDDKGWNYVNEDGLSWGDIGNIAGDIPEIAGTVAGGVAGTVAGPVGATGGAVLGGAAGKSARDLIKNLIGIKETRNLGEKYSDIGKAGIMGGTAEMGGQALAKTGGVALTKLLAPFRSKMTPESVARRDLASKYGVELTPAQVTQSPSLGQIENVLNNRIWSSDALAKFADEKQIGPFNTAIKNITPDNGADEIGMLLKDSIVNTKNANKEMFKNEYGSIANQIDKPIEVDNLINQAGKILEQNKNIPKSAQDTAVKISNEILENRTNNMLYPELSKLRTNLGDMARGGTVTGDVGTGQYKLLKKALDNDFSNYATYNGLGSIKNDVDDAYRVFKTRYEDNAIKNIIGTDRKQAIAPENVIDTIVKPNKTTMLESTIQASNNPNLVKDAVITKVIDNSKIADYSNPMYGSDMVTPTRFATQANKFGANLSKVGADDVRELGKVAESIKFSDAFANHSNTAPTLMNSSMFGMLNPLNLGGKAYTSKLGRKYLTDGLMPKDNSIGKALIPTIKAGIYTQSQ